MDIFKSKKFYSAVAGVLAVVLLHVFGIAEETTLQVAGIVIALLLGQGLTDFGKAAAPPAK